MTQLSNETVKKLAKKTRQTVSGTKLVEGNTDVSKIEMDFQENQIVENRFEVDGVLLRERREQKTHALRSGAKSMRIITRFIGDKKYEWKQMDNENHYY